MAFDNIQYVGRQAHRFEQKLGFDYVSTTWQTRTFLHLCILRLVLCLLDDICDSPMTTGGLVQKK